jgi:hypothetical protein
MSSIAFIASAQPSASITSGKLTAPQTVAANQSQPTSRSAKDSDTITISKAAQEALASSKNSTPTSVSSSTTDSVDAMLAKIKSKDFISRTAEDMNYLYAHDDKLAAIRDKENSGLGITSSEVDYMQKTVGFINTMGNLSPAEKALYDKAVASGNKEAAAGIGQIAFIRTMGHTAGGAAGTTYDPVNTEITAANIEKYFSHSIADPSGRSQSQFQALIQYLHSDQSKA